MSRKTTDRALWLTKPTLQGTIVFSYLGDLVGRRMIFWITTGVIIVFMALKTFLGPFFYPYLAFKLVAASCYVATYQLPFSIITEITDASYRSWAIGITCVTWYTRSFHSSYSFGAKFIFVEAAHVIIPKSVKIKTH